MIRPKLCDYGDAYIHFKETITVPNAAPQEAVPNNSNKNVIFKNCTPFTKCTSEINNTPIDEAHNIDAVMLMYNLIELSDTYLKKSGSAWQYYRDEPALGGNGNIIDLIVYQ